MQHKYDTNTSQQNNVPSECRWKQLGGIWTTDRIQENSARFHCAGVVLICWHASRTQMNGIYGKLRGILICFIDSTFTPSGLNVTRLTESQVSFDSSRLKGRACQGEIWPKGGGCSPSWVGQRGNKGRVRWQGGASHATLWPQAFTCRLLMALFCVNILEGTWVSAQLWRAFGERTYCRTRLWIVVSRVSSFSEVCWVILCCIKDHTHIRTQQSFVMTLWYSDQLARSIL